ncbi:MAG: YdcH family protein [Caulobacter sp.]|nr:YdcH family protein [Caulobacter sp.]
MNDDEGPISMPNIEVRGRLLQLRQRHQDLDAAVAALEDQPLLDQLQIARLKKQKLLLRDEIAQLENGLTPNIIA